MLADILGYYAKDPTKVGSLKVDIVKTVEYSYEQEVTSHPVEKGYEIHDTIVNKPLRLHLSIAISSMPVTWFWKNGTGSAKFQDGYEALVAIREAKQPITIVRPDRIITDLVMTGCKLASTNESMSVMNVELDFVQIKKVETKTVEIPQNVVDASVRDSVGETGANGGNANQTSPDTNTKNNATKAKGKSIGKVIKDIVKDVWNKLTGGGAAK